MKAYLFPCIAYGIVAIFMGLMVYVTANAYARKTGHTGMDVAKIQQVRYIDAQVKLEKKRNELSQIQQ